MKNVLLRQLVLAVVSASFAAAAVGAETRAAGATMGSVDGSSAANGAVAPAAMNPPLIDWMAPQVLNPATGVGGTLAADLGKTSTKAAWEVKTFVPITPCRLVDTRGVFSPVYAGGPFAAGETRIYRAAGNCGISAGTNRVDAVSLAITTPPTALSGDIEAISNSGTLGNTVVMVIQAGQWNSATTVTAVDSNGDFKVQLRSTPGDVVIDVNGYYASTSTANAGDYLYFSGNYPDGGGVLAISNSGTGAAINASGTASGVLLGSGPNAVDIYSGGIRVRGAGLNSGTPVFVHTATAANSCVIGGLARTVMDHPMLNANPNAIPIVGSGIYDWPGGAGSGTTNGDATNVVYYVGAATCGTTSTLNKWQIYKAVATPFATGANFPVLVIRN